MEKKSELNFYDTEIRELLVTKTGDELFSARENIFLFTRFAQCETPATRRSDVTPKKMADRQTGQPKCRSRSRRRDDR
jgi:hypothetical protein